MPNDDYLNDFIANSAFLDMWLSRDTAGQLRVWLDELLTARKYIPILEMRNVADGELLLAEQASIANLERLLALERGRAQRWIEYAATLGQRTADLQQRLASLRHGAQFYVERNQRLMEENRQLIAQYDAAIKEKWELQEKADMYQRESNGNAELVNNTIKANGRLIDENRELKAKLESVLGSPWYWGARAYSG